MDALNLRTCFVLVHLIVLGGAYMLFVKAQKLYLKWILAWILITLGAYLSRNIWIFMGVMTAVAVFLSQESPVRKIAAYFFLLPAVPSHIYYELPGLIPGIRYWVEWTYPRMLSMLILFPLFCVLLLRRKPPVRGKKFFLLATDLWIFLYVALAVILAFRDPSLTGACRQVFILFLDYVVPYYVISRSLEEGKDFRQVFLAMVFSAVILCLVGLFEELRHWRLYGELDQFLGISSLGFKGSLYRQGLLRVTATFGQPIVFGFFVTLALSGLVYLRREGVYPKIACLITGGLFFAILLLTLSRGPWVGTLLFFLTLWLLRPGALLRQVGSRLFSLLLFVPFLALLFMSTSLGVKIVRLLPFVGVDHAESVDYRWHLVQSAIPVVARHPLFGSPHFLKTDYMETLRTTEGIIDVVNAYVAIALERGLVSLVLFLGIFLSLLVGILRVGRSVPPGGGGGREPLGDFLLAQLVAVLFMIGTVSFISFVPIYTWSVVAWSSAYLLVSQNRLSNLQGHPQ